MTIFEQQVKEWIGTLNTNHWLIGKQMEGLTHEDTLLELPFRGNRLNWVLGHIAEHRDWMLRAVDCTTLMPAKEAMIYRRGSDPITDTSEVVQMETLMGYLDSAKACLTTQMESATEVFLSEKPSDGILMESQRDRTRLQRLQGLIWHETYHMGQMELLRQLAGKNDAILQ